MESSDFPAGYVPFNYVVEALPKPKSVAVSRKISLEALYLPGPPPELVFVHGGLGSLWNPYPQLNAFRGERGLLTYALAGNGKSSTRPTQSLDGHVEDLKHLLGEVGIERPLLHGHSYGTAIAIEYAKQHPCRGLVLHAGGDHDLTPAWEKPLMQLFLSLRLYRVLGNEALMRGLARWAACHEETSEALIEDFLQSNPMPRRRSAWTTVTEAFWGYDGRQDIGQVQVPTLVIHGPADRIVPIDVARGTAQRIPNAVFCCVGRTGHLGMVERPAVYNDLLRSLTRTVQENERLGTVLRREPTANQRNEREYMPIRG